MSWKTILIAAASAAALASRVAAGDSQNDIIMSPIFVDSEHNFGVGRGAPQRPGMSVEYYFEFGLYHRSASYLGGSDLLTGEAPGTIYVYRYEAIEMGGAAMGYNHVGNGAFFHPTIVLPASQVPEVHWVTPNQVSYSGAFVDSTPFVGDRADVPSIALSQELSGNVLHDYSGLISAMYLPGHDLYPGSSSFQYPKGAIDFAIIAAWGPPAPSPDPQIGYLSSISASGPLMLSLGMDGYTTTTVTLTAQVSHDFTYANLFAATTGKNASQYLEEIGYEPSPPPVWVKKMALEEKLTGKTKWLYPPLTRHADANGDGVYDAADLAAIYSLKKNAPN